jgi:hypothetical protein
MSKAMIRRVSLGLAAIVGYAAASACDPCHAAELWYDGFTTGPGGDYTAGAALGGQTGGSGTFFTGPWLQQGTNDHIVYADGLTNPGGRAVIGGSVGDDANNASCCTTSRSARMLATPWAGFTNPSGTFYVAFLANYGTRSLEDTNPTEDGVQPAPVHHRVLEMWEGDHGDDGNRNLQFGYSEFTGIGTDLTLRVRDEVDGVEDNYVVDTDLSTAGVQALSFDNDGDTHHVVVRFDLTNDDKAFGGVGDRIRVYLDPMTDTEPAIPNADTGSIDLLIDRMGVITNFIFGAPITAPRLDELRVADTFFDVRCTPEPGSVALLGLAALSFGGVARRKRV